MKRALLRLAVGGMALATLGAACSTTATAPSATTAAATAAASASAASKTAVTSSTKSADLRTTLNLMLVDHVYLATNATGAALRGDNPGFTAAAATLDKNSVALSTAIGSVYGDPAGKTFLELWRKHIGFFVDYTKATAAKDDAGQKKAVADLDGYRKDFDAFITGANPNLPKGSVAELLIPHVNMLAAAINAQAAKDPTASDKIEAAAAHSPKIADALSAAIAKQFPDKFPGSSSKAADLRTGLNVMLDEHVQLASLSTGAALRGDNTGFTAAAATLDKNSVALSTAIGSVYGDPAGKTFLELWRKHIGFFVDYTKATAAKDDAGQKKAVADLDGYRKDFDAFITGANPNLPKGSVAELLVAHVNGIAQGVTEQANKDPKQYDDFEMAVQHSQKIADPLTEAIVKQFPDKFASAN